MTHSIPERFRACLVETETPGRYGGRITSLPTTQLPPGDVLVRVEYSSANYKDALAAGGHPGVVKRLPHVPGIDAAGTVVQSASSEIPTGCRVLVTGYELGAGAWGGWAELIRVPADWIVPMPGGWTPRQAMLLGTAGFTAAQCVRSLETHEIRPEQGPILVTGATGGVGSVAVMLLANLGYSVAAVTGKPDQHKWLREIGAAEILTRDEVDDRSDRPLLKARWAGAIDTVGGTTLATVVRSLQHRGCVAACGLVGGTNLPLTVYPFLLRGVKLDGIDSAQCPRRQRLEIWQRLSTAWQLPQLEALAREHTLEQAGDVVTQLLTGRSVGRPVIRVTG